MQLPESAVDWGGRPCDAVGSSHEDTKGTKKTRVRVLLSTGHSALLRVLRAFV
jgi:hypothetical protein